MRCVWLAVALKHEKEKEPGIYTIDRQALADYFDGKPSAGAEAVAKVKGWLEATYPLTRHFLPALIGALKVQTGYRGADKYTRCVHCGHGGKADELAGAI